MHTHCLADVVITGRSFLSSVPPIFIVTTVATVAIAIATATAIRPPPLQLFLPPLSRPPPPPRSPPPPSSPLSLPPDTTDTAVAVAAVGTTMTRSQPKYAVTLFVATIIESMIRSIDGHYHRHERHCRPPDRLSTSRPSDVSIARAPKSEGPLEKTRIFSITLHRVDGGRRDIERTVRTSVIRRRYVDISTAEHWCVYPRLSWQDVSSIACVCILLLRPPSSSTSSMSFSGTNTPPCLFFSSFLHTRARTHACPRARTCM